MSQNRVPLSDRLSKSGFLGRRPARPEVPAAAPPRPEPPRRPAPVDDVDEPEESLPVINIGDSDENADWLKYLVNPASGRTYRDEELEIHDMLAAKYAAEEAGRAVGESDEYESDNT